jgi:hypothetical protein
MLLFHQNNRKNKMLEFRRILEDFTRIIVGFNSLLYAQNVATRRCPLSLPRSSPPPHLCRLICQWQFPPSFTPSPAALPTSNNNNFNNNNNNNILPVPPCTDPRCVTRPTNSVFGCHRGSELCPWRKVVALTLLPSISQWHLRKSRRRVVSVWGFLAKDYLEY